MQGGGEHIYIYIYFCESRYEFLCSLHVGQAERTAGFQDASTPTGADEASVYAEIT